MNIKPLHRAILLALAAPLVLAACGGGGGGTVRSNPPPVSPPPAAPPPLPAAFNPCPAPVNSDCVVTLAGGAREVLAAVQSNHALVVRGGTGQLGLVEDDYRFSGGTVVESGTLGIGTGRNASNWLTILKSDVTVLAPATLTLYATLDGNLVNDGWTDLIGTVTGNVVNNGIIHLSDYYDSAYQRDVLGDFRQTSNATLSIDLAPAGFDFYAAMTITGRADLGGTLQLREYTDAWGPYALPIAGTYQILHAAGGVFGTFDRWTSPGLFIEGNLRYGSHDVWFDLTRISLQAAASANGIGSPLALASAGNLDRVLATADGFAGNPTLAQQRFLTSAGRLLWMRDPLQAQRALDSLSGLPQAKTLDAALHEVGMSPALSAHLDQRARTHAAGAWSQSGVAGMQTGFDQWLDPHLLAGVHAAHGDGAQADAMLDASTQRDERRAGAYLRWFGNDGWYAGADAGYAQRTMLLDRAIDFGVAGRWNAHSRRTLDVANLGGEAGRRRPFAGGSLTPFLRLDASAVHGADTIEQGGSGFELALDPVTQHRLATSAGLRYARDWRFANGGWLQLRAGGGAQRTLRLGGDAQRAAFTGAPGAWFDLPGWSPRRSSWFDLGLHGGFGHDWRWAMQGMRSNGNEAWQLRLARDF